MNTIRQVDEALEQNRQESSALVDKITDELHIVEVLKLLDEDQKLTQQRHILEALRAVLVVHQDIAYNAAERICDSKNFLHIHTKSETN